QGRHVKDDVGGQRARARDHPGQRAAPRRGRHGEGHSGRGCDLRAAAPPAARRRGRVRRRHGGGRSRCVGPSPPGSWPPSCRRAGLGAVPLLLADTDPAAPDLHSEIPETTTRAIVEDTGDTVAVYLPLRRADLTPVAADQILCTAAGVVAASGRDLTEVTISL